VPVVVETLTRLQVEGLSRHDAVHAIGLVLAAQVFDALKHDQPTERDLNEAYTMELRTLTAQKGGRLTSFNLTSRADGTPML
jgi:hypothetical protein